MLTALALPWEGSFTGEKPPGRKTPTMITTYTIVSHRTRVAAINSCDLGAARKAAREMGMLVEHVFVAVEGNVSRGQRVERSLSLTDHVRNTLCVERNATVRISDIAPHTDRFDAWIDDVHHVLRVDDVI